MQGAGRWVIGPRRDLRLDAAELDRLPGDLLEEVGVACVRWEMSTHEQGVNWGEAKSAALAREVGGRLREALSGLFEDLDLASIGSVSVAADCEPVLPWEIALDSGGVPWGISRDVSIYHGGPGGDEGVWLEQPRPPRLVVASCMPIGMPSANVDAQRLVLGQALGRLPPSRKPSVIWLEDPQPEHLRAVVATDTTLVHVIAHGRPGEILWSEAGQPRWMTADAFCESLRGADALLADFCVCDSASVGAGGKSLAATATKTFARVAVGMRGVLGDHAGAIWLQGLLSALAEQPERVDRMVTESRLRLWRDGQGVDWARPVLFVRNGLPSLRWAAAPRESPDPQPEPETEAWLEVGSEQVPIWRKVFLVGRSTRADLVIRLRGVKPFHAAIDSLGDSGHELRDQSGEGVTINGRQVDRIALRDGDMLTIGDRQIVYRTR